MTYNALCTVNVLAGAWNPTYKGIAYIRPVAAATSRPATAGDTNPQ